MRDEKQIRKHIEQLRLVATPDCDCVRCVGNLACATALAWALGDVELDPHKEESLAAEAAQRKAARK